MKRTNSLLFVLPVLIVALAVVAIVWVTSQPEVVQARAQLESAVADKYLSQTVYHENLKDILVEQTKLVLVVGAAAAALMFVLAVSISLVIANVDRFVSHGLEYERTVNGQKTSVKLFQTSPAAALPKGRGAGGNQGYLPRPEPVGQLPARVQTSGSARPLRPEDRQAPGKSKDKSNGRHDNRNEPAFPVRDLPRSVDALLDEF